MKNLLLLAALCFLVPVVSAKEVDVYQEFTDTLRQQNEKGCDTSYVGGYVSLYQSLTLLCNLRKDKAISEDDFNRYAKSVIGVLASGDRLSKSNIRAALMYATEMCGKDGVDLPLQAE